VTTPSRAFAPLDFLQLISIAFIWGVNNILAKIAIDTLTPMLTLVFRFALVVPLLIFWMKPPPRERWKPFALMLLFVGPLHFGIQYVALALADEIAPMVVAMQLWAPASVVFAAIVLKEHVSRLRWAGVAVAFFGVAAMTFDPAVFAQGWPLAMVVIAAAFYGLGTVLVRRIGGGVDAWSMQAWIAIATAPTMAVGSLLFERGQLEAIANAPLITWFAIAFGAIVSSIVANAFMFSLVQKYEVSRTTPYLLMTPVISFALAALVLGDTITPQILMGAAATMGGVALVALAERRFKAMA
jgi:O-acetylserine/cysteine efflux transporter